MTRGDWQLAVSLHPYDGESLANLARVHDELGEFEKAFSLHRRAIGAAGAREDKYGVFFGYAMHLSRRGASEFRERRPRRALYLYLESQAVASRSLERRYRRGTTVRPALKNLAKQIEFLLEARIEPEVFGDFEFWEEL